ncbi:MAG: hypothetical protein ACTS6J_03800 [Burkholderiales bacterium]
MQRGNISIFALFGAGGAAFMYSGGILVTESIPSVIAPAPTLQPLLQIDRC